MPSLTATQKAALASYLRSVLAGEWVQTSYNNNPVEGASRGKYAGIGDIWDGTVFSTPTSGEPE